MLLHKSKENASENGQNQLFSALKIDQGLSTIWVSLIQEKWLNHGKNSKFRDVLTCLILILLSSSMVGLKNQRPHNHGSCENQWLGSHWRGQNGFGAFQSTLSPENCHYLIWQLTGKAPFLGIIFNMVQNLLCANIPILRAFVKNNQQSGVEIPVGTNKRLIKKIKRKNWGMR